jgi:tripeptidyl-peptidase-2
MRGIILLLFMWNVFFAQQESSFPFISLNTTGIEDFQRQYPGINGDSVVVFILDSGVDMGVAGLEKLPNGEVKVIEARDFSGQGDVYFDVAELQEDSEGPFLSDGYVRLYGFSDLAEQAHDSTYYIGYFSERRLRNSAVDDPNNDGDSDDIYGILVFAAAVDDWVAVIDTDADTNVDDEALLRDYARRFDTFQFRGRARQFAANLLTAAINIYADENRLSLHFDDNGHGSHCAGIAAGYAIHGRQEFNGAAPGARIISLKIGDNTLSGGATTTGSMQRAFTYAAAYAEAHPQFAYVINMSYGIGSEVEGQSEIDIWLDQFLADHPQLTLFTSNGNEGPGISTTGTPAAGHRSISVGAMLTRESARDTYGFNTRQNEVFYFSSRGGDSEKPTIIAPGAASSTVPYFENNENYWGTSMASPHAAGATALLLHRLRREYPNAKADNLLLTRALQNSAIPLAGYTWVDFGAGLLNLPGAWQKLAEMYGNRSAGDDIAFKINAPNSEFASQTGAAAFYRAAGYLPTEKQRIQIKPQLPKTWDADKRARYFQDFSLIHEGDFFRLREEQKYAKGTNAARLTIDWRPEKMKGPGLYTGMIYGIPGQQSKRKENAVFRIPVVVVRPHFFAPQNNDLLRFPIDGLKTGKISRSYFQVERNIQALQLDLLQQSAPDNRLRIYIFDQEGRRVFYLNSNEKRENRLIESASKQHGTWEMVVFADYNNRDDVTANIRLQAYRVAISELGNAAMEWQAGSNPKGDVTFVNDGNKAFTAALTGQVSGYRRSARYRLSSDTYSLPVMAEQGVEKIVYQIEIPQEDFLKVTDLAVNILDYDGVAIKRIGMSYRFAEITFYPQADTGYDLEFVAGFTHAWEKNWQFVLTETRYYKYPYYLITDPGSNSNLQLLPGSTLQASFEAEEPLPSLPQGYRYYFHFQFNDDAADVKLPVFY